MSDQAEASDPAPATPKVVPSVPPHPEVAIALGLGWHVAELYHFEGIPGEVEHGGPEGLPGIGGLSRGDRADLLVSQIVAVLERLGHQTHEWEANRQRLVSPPVDVAALQHGVGDAHRALLKTLTARDAPLGKAYGLGRALAETTLIPTTQEPKSFVEQFDPYRIRTLQAQLADLRAALPKYAAEVVGRTLDAWVTWAVAGKLGAADIQWPTEEKRHVGQSLRRQGEVWYGLLTGDLEPLRMLRQEDYAAAAEALLAGIGKLAWGFLAKSTIGKVLGFMIALLIALFVGVVISGHLAAVTGTAVLLLGALGVTAGGVISSVRQVLLRAQTPLWEAELTGGIAAVALHVPTPGLAGTRDQAAQ
ncbi:MAG: hypothetical protein ACR2JY_04545 [Chloroflexota bacterium]